MLKVLRKRFSADMQSLLLGLSATFLLFVMIGIWRLFDTNTFLFIQLVISSILLYILIVFLGIFPFAKFFVSREFLSILIAFTVASSLLLNIDRSRSVYLVKWVYQYSKESPVPLEEIIAVKRLTEAEGLSIKQRVGEQGQLAFIKNDQKGLSVTWLGRAFVSLAEICSKLFNLNGFERA
jgi:hypothetical protein